MIDCFNLLFYPLNFREINLKHIIMKYDRRTQGEL